MSQLGHPLDRRHRDVRQPVVADVQSDEVRQLQRRKNVELDAGKFERVQAPDVVAQRLEVDPQRVGREVKGSKPAHADEDVVRQDGEAVVGEGEGQKVRHVGEHGGVEMLDGVARQVQVPEVRRDLGQRRRRHRHELVGRQVDGFDRRRRKDVARQRPEPVVREVHDSKPAEAGKLTELQNFEVVV